MSEPDEEFVHSSPFLEKRHRAIGLDYAKQNGARAAGGTGAERRRRTRRVFAGASHVWLMNVLFQTRQRLAQIGGVRIREVAGQMITNPDAEPSGVDNYRPAHLDVAVEIHFGQVAGYDFVEIGGEGFRLVRGKRHTIDLDMELRGFSHGCFLFGV